MTRPGSQGVGPARCLPLAFPLSQVIVLFLEFQSKLPGSIHRSPGCSDSSLPPWLQEMADRSSSVNLFVSLLPRSRRNRIQRESTLF